MPDASDRGWQKLEPGAAGDRRAQSEVIGYVLVFSVVIVALGATAVFGFTALEQVRESTVVNNGERVIETVGGDIDALYQGTALARSTEVTLNSGEVGSGQPVSMRVVVESGGRLPDSVTAPYPVADESFRPIVYRGGGGEVAYDNTLVIREEADGAVAVTDHMFQLSGEQSVVPIVATVPPEPQSASGGNIQIQTALVGSESHVVTRDEYAPSPTDPITVRLELAGLDPEGADVWLRALNAELEDAPTPGNPACFHPGGDQTRVECRYETNRLLVSVVEVRYEFE